MNHLDKPAMPVPGLSNLPNGEFIHPEVGMTIRQHAALTLRVPMSGDPELDAMIREARRLDMATAAMQGLLANGVDIGDREQAQLAFKLGDALLAASEPKKAEQERLCATCGKPTMHAGDKCYSCCQTPQPDAEGWKPKAIQGPARRVFYGGNTNEHMNPEVVLISAEDYAKCCALLAASEPKKADLSCPAEWVARKVSAADDGHAAAGRPCDGPNGCNASNCIGCGENPQPNDEGWIEWKGGALPVDFYQMVRVRLRNGNENESLAGRLWWRHTGHDDDIIAYKINGGK